MMKLLCTLSYLSLLSFFLSLSLLPLFLPTLVHVKFITMTFQSQCVFVFVCVCVCVCVCPGTALMGLLFRLFRGRCHGNWPEVDRHYSICMTSAVKILQKEREGELEGR